MANKCTWLHTDKERNKNQPDECVLDFYWKCWIKTKKKLWSSSVRFSVLWHQSKLSSTFCPKFVFTIPICFLWFLVQFSKPFACVHYRIVFFPLPFDLNSYRILCNSNCTQTAGTTIIKPSLFPNETRKISFEIGRTWTHHSFIRRLRM